MENVGAGLCSAPTLPQTAKPRGRTVSGVCFNLDYLDLRRFCSTQRAVILPNVRMLNRAGEELSPVWGITPDACAVGVAVTAGRAVGAGVAGVTVAVLSAGAVEGAAVGATVGAAVGSAGLGVAGIGEGVGAFIPCAAFSAAPGERTVAVLFLAVSGFQRFSLPAAS